MLEDRHVHLEVLDDSRRARALYERMGFQEVGVLVGPRTGRMKSIMCLAASRSANCGAAQEDHPGGQTPR
jgi:hypothetical protein